jgi:AcrR family transcriptional regulator
MAERESLRARQNRLARDAILDAAIDLIEQFAFDAVTMPDVAAAAGVSLRTLYRYYPNREDLVVAAGQQIRDRMGLTDDIATPQDIPASFWSASANVAKYPQLARALLRTPAGLSARAPGRAKRTAQIHDVLAPLTATFASQEAEQIAAVVAHLCNSRSWISICDETGLSTEGARRAVVWALQILLGALGVEGSDISNEQPEGATP